MKYCVYLLLLVLLSCESSKESDTPSIAGRWEYKTIEWFNGEPFTLNDSISNVLHQQHVGLILTLTKKKSFIVTQIKAGKEVNIAEQPYELPPGDSILRLKNTGRPDDEFPIIGLNDSLLRVNLFHSNIGYPVFRRVE